MDIQTIIGVVGGPVAIVALTDHLKRAVAALPWTADRTNAAPWPLVSDLLGVAWAVALWHGGLLAPVFPEVVELTWPVVVLIGLAVFGLGSSALVDGKRALRAPAPAQSGG